MSALESTTNGTGCGSGTSTRGLDAVGQCKGEPNVHRDMANRASEMLQCVQAGDPSVVGRNYGAMSWLPETAQRIASRHLGVEAPNYEPIRRITSEAEQFLAIAREGTQVEKWL